MNRNVSNSIRKYIRKEKARIRRTFFSLVEQKNKIKELVERSCSKAEPAEGGRGGRKRQNLLCPKK